MKIIGKWRIQGQDVVVEIEELTSLDHDERKIFSVLNRAHCWQAVWTEVCRQKVMKGQYIHYPGAPVHLSDVKLGLGWVEFTRNPNPIEYKKGVHTVHVLGIDHLAVYGANSFESGGGVFAYVLERVKEDHA